MSVSAGGGSMKSKWIRSLMPRLFSISTTEPRLVRWISGIVLSSSSFRYAHLVYSRKHLPGATRPARPARWLADALATGVTISDSMPVRGLYEFCLAKPVAWIREEEYNHAGMRRKGGVEARGMRPARGGT
tara:strand:+ start:1163 stop:1555 length:393 start_codon:yes stop_codon:yes gene_type:complete